MAKDLISMIRETAAFDRTEPSVYYRIANQVTKEKHVHAIVSSVNVQDEHTAMVAIKVLAMTDRLLRSYATHVLNRLLREDWNKQGRFLEVAPEFCFTLLRALKAQEERTPADAVTRRIVEYCIGLRRRYGRLVEDEQKRQRGKTLLASLEDNDFERFADVLADRGC